MKTAINNLVKVLLNDDSSIKVEEGTTLQDIYIENKQKFGEGIICAKVNEEIRELTYEVKDNCRVEFLDITHPDGIRVYMRSVMFVLIKSFKDVFPDKQISINDSIGGGYYFEVKSPNSIDESDIEILKKKMQQVIEQKIPFVKSIMTIEEARELYKNNDRLDRFKVLKNRNKPYVTLYKLDNFQDYLYGYMTPDTSYVKVFDVIKYKDGIVLLKPDVKEPSKARTFKEYPQLFNVFSECKNWGKILNISNVGDLNELVGSQEVHNFIRVAEALHEKKIAEIADMIHHSENEKRIICIAGPSSSGKTTFAQRLAIQLRVNGLKPVTLSLDDYFLNRKDTPRDEDGNYNFETIDALDLKLFNQHLSDLVDGKEVGIPTFDFTVGQRLDTGKKMRLAHDEMLIIEGIHGLNERLTNSISRDKKFKIYVSALTSLNIDEYNRIPTTDTRLLRRIVRDNQFRGSTALNTISVWPSVRRGEEIYIFPFQEEADIMFNSALRYELGILRVHAEPLLKEIVEDSPAYSEAKRLIEFISNFTPIKSVDIPSNSIIREFIGGSCF